MNYYVSNLLRELTMHPLTVSLINFEFTVHSWIHYKTCGEFTKDLIAISRPNFVSSIYIANWSKMNDLLRWYDLNSITSAQIHFELIFYLTNGQQRNDQQFRELTNYLRINHQSTIYFRDFTKNVNGIKIHDLFREFVSPSHDKFKIFS